MTVGFKDAVELHRGRRLVTPGTDGPLGRVVGRRIQTTAELEVLRFYRKHLGKPQRKLSLAERAEALPSPFAVATFLEEIRMLKLKPKLEARLHEICRVRLATLRGVIP